MEGYNFPFLYLRMKTRDKLKRIQDDSKRGSQQRRI